MDTNMTSQSDPKARRKIVCSIPHSGTHFLRHHFNCTSLHVCAHWGSVMRRLPADAHIIVPLRKPAHVWHSWGRRMENPDLAYFMQGWYNLHAMSLIFDLDFIDLEAQDDPRITDWTPRGTLDEYEFTPKLLPYKHRNVLHQIPFVQERYGLPVKPDEFCDSEELLLHPFPKRPRSRMT
jgi:hypothetical protein